MLQDLPYNLKAHLSPGAQIINSGLSIWRLEIPAGPANRYRLAQLDDYWSLPRSAFPWSPPLLLSLRARASVESIPGTWGFGLWNDPFSMGVLGGWGGLRLPALPNAVWFFSASPPNYLSLRNDLPPRGWVATTFCSPKWRSVLLAPGALALPLLLLPPAVQFFRRLGSRIVQQDAVALSIDPTAWHSYQLAWAKTSVEFRVDDQVVLQTTNIPLERLGLVIWIDNQYAAIPPTGRLRYGFLSNPEPVWIEIGGLSVTPI